MYPTEISYYAQERINDMIKARKEHDRWRKLAPQNRTSSFRRLQNWWQGLGNAKPQRRLKRS